MQSGLLATTSDFAVGIPTAEAIVVVVPLLVSEETWEPDFKWLDTATHSIAEHLSKTRLSVMKLHSRRNHPNAMETTH